MTFTSGGCGNCEVTDGLHPFKKLASALTSRRGTVGCQDQEAVHGRGCLCPALLEPVRSYRRACRRRLSGAAVLRGSQLEIGASLRSTNPAGAARPGAWGALSHLRHVGCRQLGESCLGTGTRSLPAAVHQGVRAGPHAALPLRIHGVISVSIDDKPFTKTWWRLSGDSVTEFSSVAKSQLVTWDTRYDDEEAEWRRSHH